MAIIKIRLTKEKLLEELFYKGAKGTYIDLTLLENRNGLDQYGNNFMAVQDISKEARQRGEKGPIVGNAKYFNPPNKQESAPVEQPSQAPTDDVSW